MLPIDDTSFRIYVAGRVKERGEIGRSRSKMNGKFWWELSEEEHQKFPGDFEAQVGQGPITYHSDEHLATSDQGVVMLRRLGKDPACVSFNENAPAVVFTAGNYIVDRNDERVAKLLAAEA